jgi:hypothetical protein
MDIVARSKPAVSLVSIYADRPDLKNGFNLFALVAEQIGLQVDHAQHDLLSRAILLERSILPQLHQNPSVPAASLVYRYALQLAAVPDLPSDAFLSLCSTFETLQIWFPHAESS